MSRALRDPPTLRSLALLPHRQSSTPASLARSRAAMASEPVPVFTDLVSVYGTDGAAEANERYRELKEAFERAYGAAPELYSRSPGRVNLIGEHIDYEGYGVLPMAIKQDTVFAFRSAGSSLQVANVNGSKYAPVEFRADHSQEVDRSHHTWANYFLAAYKGVFEYLASKGMPLPQERGIQVMVDGRVPTGAGLSSSSAFVCAAAIGLLGVFGVSLTKGEVAEFTAKCERHVGTESGGMDQAISLMGRPGVAMNIDFNPVRGGDVAVPTDGTFVIANSLTVSNKAETGPRNYNMRVVECRLAAACLAVALGTPPADARRIVTLREVEPLVAQGNPDHEAVLEAAARAAQEHLHAGKYTQEEVESVLGVRLETLLEGRASQLQVLPVAAQGGGFSLRDRAVHVFTEAARVETFRRVCASGAPGQEVLSQLGELMNASHASCRDRYECSCPELEELVGLARAHGALGARLTGAGWGGCAVMLVGKGREGAFISALREGFFAKRVAAKVPGSEDSDEAVFASRPAAGGALLRLKL